MEEKEKRVRAITSMYYSNPKVQEAILKFAQGREVVPRYFEAFGKRPDTLQYNSDVLSSVKKGATSFHCSEELWHDPLQLNLEMNQAELSALRKGWDLLIDVDSPFLDYSKIATLLLIEALEHHGIENYGIKFSGSKGFHVIVPQKTFPQEFNGEKTKDKFPDWPRAICEYLMNYIKEEYNKSAGEITSVGEITKRTNLSKEELEEVACKTCGKRAVKGEIVKMMCPECGLIIERKDVKLSKRRLKCLNADCAGILGVVDKSEYFYCENCVEDENKKIHLSSDKYPENFIKTQGVSAKKIASLDFVLVAPRHLFRMPYSLHEKTALASVVLKKNEILSFLPNDADPMKVAISDFLPNARDEEAKKLLSSALDWEKGQDAKEKKIEERKYANKEFEEVDASKITENMFPPAIKKLLEGLSEGKKRGLFILLTFLRTLNFSPEQINKKIHEWNEKNNPPLKEGYVRSQIEWHLRQKKKILPPNYSNDAFYKDLGLLTEKPKTKNPLVDVMRQIWKNNESKN